VTQQNAALAEQTSAASASLNEKAKEMDELMSLFQVTGSAPAPQAAARQTVSAEPKTTQWKPEVVTRPKPAAAPKPKAVPQRPAAGKTSSVQDIQPAADDDGDEWEEF